MNFSDQTLDYLSRVRQEISRLERSLLRLKELASSLESFLQDTEPVHPSPPPLLSPLSASGPIPEPVPSHRSSSSFLTPISRTNASEGSIGDLAIRILRSEDRPFDLNEIADRIRAEMKVPESRDLKNAVRVALVRRKGQVLHEGRGLYRFTPFLPP